MNYTETIGLKSDRSRDRAEGGISDIGNIVYFICTLLFVINPFFTITIMLFFTVIEKIEDDKWLKTLMALLILFIWLIQMNRTVCYGQPSDWVNGYNPIFQKAGKTDVFSYLSGASKEPAFQLINYIGYYLSGGNFILYASTLIATMYSFVYVAIYKFWKTTSTNVLYLIGSLVIFTFITENLGITNNLLRQQFAMGIMTYVMARKIIDGKMNWWLAAIACLTHTLMFVFVLVLFIKPLYRVIKIKQLIRIGGIIILIVLLISNISFLENIFAFSSTLSYGFNRIETLSLTQSKDVLESSFMVLLNIVLFVLFFLKMNYMDKPKKSEATYTNLLVFLLFGCFALDGIAPMLQIRLYITRFFFLPFVLPFFFRNNKLYSHIYLYTIIGVFYIRFFITVSALGRGTFFPPIENLITGTLFNYLAYTPTNI